MGYRSEVLIAFKAKHIKRFLEEVVFTKSKELFDNWCEISTEFEDPDDENGILFHWDSIKWYDSYDSVNAVMAFIHNLPDDEGQTDYYYIRIGEEPSDVELEGYWWDNPFEIGLNRSVNYGGGKAAALKDLEELRNKRETPNENRYEEILKEI